MGGRDHADIGDPAVLRAWRTDLREATLVPRDGAGHGAMFVPEEFVLSQVPLTYRGVHRDEGSRPQRHGGCPVWASRSLSPDERIVFTGRERAA